MKIAGIVAEYNPFHKGHAHLIDRLRAPEGDCRATHVVAVMSGNFVQRGEPALLPKSYRVRAALAGGADLVVELPVPWALASAEGFASGAVGLLDAMGCVDVLGFGSECGDADALTAAAEALESPRLAQLLTYYMESGRSFPEARQKAVLELAGNRVADLFDTANNTLGIEYIKALRRRGSAIAPYTVRRMGAAHDAPLPTGDMASGSFLRSLIAEGRGAAAMAYIPPAAAEPLRDALAAGHAPADVRLIERALLAALRGMTAEQIAALPNIREGLENRVANAARSADSYEHLIEAIKTRRYTRTRIQRILWAAFLGIPAGLEQQTPPYLRVLGMNGRGEEILHAIKRTGGETALPVISRAAHADRLTGTAQTVWALECRAADLYALALPRPFACGSEQTFELIKR